MDMKKIIICSTASKLIKYIIFTDQHFGKFLLMQIYNFLGNSKTSYYANHTNLINYLILICPSWYLCT
jgi:hypothetical protein